MKLAEHIEQLVDELDADWIPVSSWEHSYANARTRLVRGPKPVKNLVEYYVMLHELGHIANNHHLKLGDFFAGVTSADTQAQEVEAWEWAFKHAKRAPSMAAWDAIGGALQTYAVTPWLSESDSPKYTRIMADIEKRLGRKPTKLYI